MPRRSNKFQKLIHLIHRQLVDCKVLESPLFVDKLTGAKKEVDIAIISEIAGYPVIIGIECRDHKRPQSRPWVDEMWGKHEHLPTTKLVLVSSSGFYSPAYRAADKRGVELRTLEQAIEEDWPTELPRLRKCRIIEVWRTPVRCTVVADERWFPLGMLASELANLSAYSEDGSRLGTLQNILDQAIEQVKLKPSPHVVQIEETSFDLDACIPLPKGTYLEEKQGQHIALRELMFRLHFDGIVRDVELEQYRFDDSFVLSASTISKNAEIVYTITTKDEQHATAGATVVEWKNKPAACIWDVAVTVDSIPESVKNLPTLSYLDPNQYKSSGKPSPDSPKLSLKFEILSKKKEGTENNST